MYDIITNIYHNNQPNVGKYSVHGWYGQQIFRCNVFFQPCVSHDQELATNVFSFNTGHYYYHLGVSCTPKTPQNDHF